MFGLFSGNRMTYAQLKARSDFISLHREPVSRVNKYRVGSVLQLAKLIEEDKSLVIWLAEDHALIWSGEENMVVVQDAVEKVMIAK